MTNPGFLLMARDWLASTFVCSLTREERSMYFDLLCHAWLNEGLPNDVAALARILGEDPIRFGSAWDRLRTHFASGSDGKLRNAKQEAERQKQADLAVKRTAASKRANGIRWRSDSDSAADPIRTPHALPKTSLAGASSPAPAPNQKTPSESPPTPKRSKPEPVPFPPVLDVPDFLNALHEYESSRPRKHKPAGLRALLKELEPFGPVEAARALRASTANGWLGVFPGNANGAHVVAVPKDANGLSPEVAEGLRMAEAAIAARKARNGIAC